MADGQTEVSIDASPDDVWKLVREFGTLDEWMPGIESCTVEGDVRTMSMMGMEIKEQLRSLDDDKRAITYSVIKLPLDGLESHTSTISVEPEGRGSKVTWYVDVQPDEMIGMFLPVYEGSIGEIKKKVEG